MVLCSCTSVVGLRNWVGLLFIFCTNRPLILLYEIYIINLKCYEKQCYYGGHNSTSYRKITAVDEILWCVSITVVNSINSFKRDLGRGSKAAGWAGVGLRAGVSPSVSFMYPLNSGILSLDSTNYLCLR